MAHRMAVMIFAALVVLSSIPLYTLVQQEYIPSNVDEAEFKVSVTAPQGTSLAAIDAIMQAVENELRAIPLVRLMLCDAGGGFISGVGTGGCYVRMAPHDERVFSFTRLWRETLNGQPWVALRNTSQRDVMQQVRAGLKKFTDLRTSVRNLPTFNIGGGNWDIDFVLRGPNLQTLAAYGEELRIRSTKARYHRCRYDAQAHNPELRVVIDRKRAADLNVDTEHIASALRLMVGGDEKVSRFIDPSVNEQYDVGLRLSQSDREDIGTISHLLRPARGAPVWCGLTTWCWSHHHERVAHRPVGSSAPGEPARSGRSRFRPRRSSGGAQWSDSRNESTRRIQHYRVRAGT